MSSGTPVLPLFEVVSFRSGRTVCFVATGLGGEFTGWRVTPYTR